MATTVLNQAATVLGEAGILLSDLFTQVLPTALFWITCSIVVATISFKTPNNFRQRISFEHQFERNRFMSASVAYVIVNMIAFIMFCSIKLDRSDGPGPGIVGLSYMLAMIVVHICVVGVVAIGCRFRRVWKSFSSAILTDFRPSKTERDIKRAEDLGSEKVVSKVEERAYIDDSGDTMNDWQPVSSDVDTESSFLKRIDEHHAKNKRSLAAVRQRQQERTAD
ncbi:hypothetical protein LTR22_017468 [Elasticomyces elasticus]|nr:hypothetical protein LTR22_017468 [Elasticomyces elasticus]KAK4924618.1 hypothetical protein LTR49_008301 [Elasticomyces elasticus]